MVQEFETGPYIIYPIYFDLNLGGSVEYKNFNLCLTYFQPYLGDDDYFSFLINLGYRFEL
jgi:hypothetical protein